MASRQDPIRAHGIRLGLIGLVKTSVVAYISVRATKVLSHKGVLIGGVV